MHTSATPCSPALHHLTLHHPPTLPYQYTYFFGDRRTQMFSSSYYDKVASEGPWGW